jgi:hypothetical protein
MQEDRKQEWVCVLRVAVTCVAHSSEIHAVLICVRHCSTDVITLLQIYSVYMQVKANLSLCTK